jgi:DNA-binding NarL/FixJ family response regulator
VSLSSTSVCRVLCVCSTDVAAQKVDQALAFRQESQYVEFTRVGTMLDGLGELARSQYDVVVAEIRPTDGPGINAGEELRRHAPDIPLILLTTAVDREAAVAAVRGGARDFFTIEDLDSEALRRSVQRASESDNGRSATGADRRNNARFPCRMAISWRTLEQPLKTGEATSETLNISSKGILFATSEQFELGQLLQVSLDWPARLGNEVPLKLVAEGRVLRNSQGQAAMSIERYEFRTRRVPPAPHVNGAAQPHKPAGTMADR